MHTLPALGGAPSRSSAGSSSTSRRLDGMLQGDYRGLVPGHGSESGETRGYQAGDDVRRIDWNVTARMQEPYVRRTIADRSSRRGWWSTAPRASTSAPQNCEKRDLAVAAVAAVGFLTARTATRRPRRRRCRHRHLPPAAAGPPPRRPAPPSSPRRRATTARTAAHPGRPRRRPAPGQRPRPPAQAWPSSSPTSSAPTTGSTSACSPPARSASRSRSSTPRARAALPWRARPRRRETGERREIRTSERLRPATPTPPASSGPGSPRHPQRGADHLVLRTDRDWLLDLVRFVTLRRQRVETTPRPLHDRPEPRPRRAVPVAAVAPVAARPLALLGRLRGAPAPPAWSNTRCASPTSTCSTRVAPAAGVAALVTAGSSSSPSPPSSWPVARPARRPGPRRAPPS